MEAKEIKALQDLSKQFKGVTKELTEAVKVMKEINAVKTRVRKEPEIDIQSILEECKKRYPIGTKCNAISCDLEFLVNGGPYIDGNSISVYGGEWRVQRYLHIDGKFAEIVEESFVPKRGDFVKEDNGDRTLIVHSLFTLKSGHTCVKAIVVSRKIEITVDLYENGISCGWLVNFKPATEQEKQLLLDKIHEVGKDWDAEKMEVVDWKWRAKNGEYYWIYENQSDNVLKSIDENDSTDLSRREIGNYFQTEQQAKDFQTYCKNYFKK